MVESTAESSSGGTGSAGFFTGRVQNKIKCGLDDLVFG